MGFIVSCDVKVFKSLDDLSYHFAELLMNEVNSAKHLFNLVLSGGTTPKNIFNFLAINYQTKINWNMINFFWGDERCVTPDNDESNYKLAFDNLLSKVNIPVENIHRIVGEAIPEVETDRYSELIKNNVPLENGTPVFDMIMLGLGEDGHIASIFPNQLNLINSNTICAVAIHPSSNQKRITLTGKVINSSKNIVFVVTGEKKSKVAYEIISNKSNSNKYPASFIRPINGKLIWLMDQSAASLL
ncbi:MAG TPA: 6-phosphogluconolactonase [Ignavibacteriales bacterium]|nr:6-phosphogluconolactonase [Ignavibacteriales bacterium]